ncbi:MAG: tripartite tricarboxylate transporter substrate binding protein [Alphaproteobacteria bacterium]|nr:tripartite tricarboxylate transporter substrate binding protein [Alphaproteobacteria bacterium]
MIDRRQFLLSSAAVASATPAIAQAAWPTKPISIVILFAAGSGTDTMARIFAEKLSAAVGQPVTVDNKPGGNGTIAGAFVARAAPDGHTLMFTSNTSHAAAQALVKNVPYDPVKDFECIGLIGLVPFVMVAHPAAPFDDLQSLIAYAKANPGKLSFGSGNSTGVVAGETLKRMAGIDTLHVPYKSVPQALTDTLSGTVNYLFSDVGTVLPHIKAGRVKAITSISSQRSPNLPDLRTLHEQGVAFDLDGWYAMFAPARTPRPIVDRLNAIVRAEYSKPEMEQRMKDINVILKLGSPEELLAFQKAEIDKWLRLAREAGIQPEG